VTLDISKTFGDQQFINAATDKRSKEVSLLLDEISEEGFSQEVLDFPSQIKIDTDSFIMSGHSMGGATALRAVNDDKRFKACIGFDPWFRPFHQ
jgi:dienelactone hydrolase